MLVDGGADLPDGREKKGRSLGGISKYVLNRVLTSGS